MARHPLPQIARGFIATVALAGATFCSNSPAQNTAKAEQHSGTQILFLGTAGGPPLHEDRSEPATLLVVDGRPYLIDCGIGTMRRMLQAGIHSEQIKTIFFTHLHSDHDLGLADVMANDYFRLGLTGSDHPVNIYGPPQTKELVDAAFRYITISVRPFAAQNPNSYRMVNGDFVSPFVTHEINREGVVFQDDKIRVTAAENSHYARLMPEKDRRKFKSYSYRIETPHGTVVFTGDTGPSDSVARLAKGADVLVAEASYRDPADLDRIVNSMATQNHWPESRAKAFRAHFQFQHLDTPAIGELAAKAQVKSVLLYHYDPLDSSDQAAYVSGVKKYFSGPVFAPNDLDRYCLDAQPGSPRPNAAVIAPCAEVPTANSASSEIGLPNKEQPRTLLAIFAHPDDETWVGPVLAHYARKGVKVYLAIATKGEKGTNQYAGIPAGEQLAAVRQQEAICASQQLGIESPIFLGFINDELDTGTGHEGEQKLHSLAQHVRELITTLRPQVVTTWGPGGGYGHRDHRLVSDAVTEVVQSESTGPRLYYVGFTAEQATLLNRWAGHWESVASDFLTVNVPFGPLDLEAYHRGLHCHKSQFTTEGAAKLEQALDQGWSGKVSFRTWAGDLKSEDLFH